MVKIKLYEHKIFPIENGEVLSKHYMAVDMVQKVAEILASTYNGEVRVSGDSFQVADTVMVSELTEDQQALIEACFPFASVLRNQFQGMWY